MVNYRLIMGLLLEGTSYRDIQSRCGAAHATTAKARKALNEHAITTHTQLAGYSDDELTMLIGDGRLSTSEDYVPIDVTAVLKARTGRKKTPLNVLWSNYLTLPATGGQSHY